MVQSAIRPGGAQARARKARNSKKGSEGCGGRSGGGRITGKCVADIVAAQLAVGAPVDVREEEGRIGETGLMLGRPTTTKIKLYPFEAAIADDPPGVALADQVKSLDLCARKAKLKGKINAIELAEIRGKATALLGRR